MHCDEFENRLNDLLDRRARPDLDHVLCAHAQRCDACGDILLGHELLLEGLAGQPTPRPSADMTERILASCRSEVRPAMTIHKNKRRLWRGRFMAWGAAAAVVLAIGTGVYWGQLSPSPTSPIHGSTTVAQQPIVTQQPVIVQRPAVVRKTTIFQNSAIARLSSAARELPSAYYLTVFEDPAYLDRMKASLSSDMPIWVGGATCGLRPLANSMEGAIDALRSSVPNFLIAG